MNPVIERFPGIETQFIMVGEGGVFTEPTAVQTVLGSCVSVTFFSPRYQVGGIFHALMPRRADYERSLPGDSPYRYVDTAIEVVCRRLFALGIKQQDVECKIFGGANALFQHELSIGPRNVQVAFETLAGYPLRITASNVGGLTGRKIIFISHTGEVFVKQLRKVNANNQRR